MTLDPAEVAHWQQWVGRREVVTQRLDVESLRRFAAALGEDLDVEHRQPSLAHWAFFLPVVAPDEIGADGHPRRGGFLPPIGLPRRMFAASQMHFEAPLRLDAPATRTSEVASVTAKAGRSGALVLVEVAHAIAQDGGVRIRETQTIVYRDAGDAMPAVLPAELAAGADDVRWQPGPVDLFRFSAVTFNSHRIHYDLPYATGEEGYPGLVVHGPFTAAKLFGHARRNGEVPRGFRFRAQAPLFAGQPVVLRDGAEAGSVEAVRCDGAVAMAALALF